MNYQENQTHPAKRGVVAQIKDSLSFKIIVIAFLCLLMLIPLQMVRNLINERQSREYQVTQKIHQKWGDQLVLGTPVLKLPYSPNYVNHKESGSQEYNAYGGFIYVYPKQCSISSEVNTQSKQYGIYKSAVYQSQHQLLGTFSRKLIEEDINPKLDIDWSMAKIVMDIPSTQGVKSSLAIHFANDTIPLKNSSIINGQKGYNGSFLLESRNIDLTTVQDLDFQMNMDVNGSSGISYIPLAQEMEVSLHSDWDTKSFDGAFLPNASESEDSKESNWKVMSYNRKIPSMTMDALPHYREFAFGIQFLQPVNEYLRNERTAKYGILVISLTFLTFFLIQIYSSAHIHGFQYLLIGLALALFYVMLLSFSEHIGFNYSYLIAGSMVIGLVSLFAKSVFRNWKHPSLVFISLSSIYTFLFVIMHLETYSLVVGSIGLFLILSVVMFFSRKLNLE